MTLWRSWHIERSFDPKVLATMLEHVDLGRIEVDSRLFVCDEGIGIPAIPKPAHDLCKLCGALVAFAMLYMSVPSEVECLLRICGRHNVPACPTSTDVIQRRKLASHMERLVICSRDTGDQANVPGQNGQC